MSDYTEFDLTRAMTQDEYEACLSQAIEDAFWEAAAEELRRMGGAA